MIWPSGPQPRSESWPCPISLTSNSSDPPSSPSLPPLPETPIPQLKGFTLLRSVHGLVTPPAGWDSQEPSDHIPELVSYLEEPSGETIEHLGSPAISEDSVLVDDVPRCEHGARESCYSIKTIQWLGPPPGIGPPDQRLDLEWFLYRYHK